MSLRIVARKNEVMKTPRLSKLNLDEIERPLARYYGLRPVGEELDFVINYDVKYRMGASAGEREHD